MLAVKHAKTRAAKEGKAARNEERIIAKALKVAREVTKGAELLKAIELFGNPKLKSLALPEFLALLTNARILTRKRDEAQEQDRSHATRDLLVLFASRP
jgi:hypothetical protein